MIGSLLGDANRDAYYFYRGIATNMNVQSNVEFPITVFFENGDVELFESVEDLELNLEDFNSDNEPDCVVKDACGRELRLCIELLRLKTLEIAS